MSLLADRLLTIHAALDTADIPHAFGGAIALAYCTGEPRATIDLDLNIFVPHTHPEKAISAMPDDVVITLANRQELARSGQTRAWWDDTPIDLFFANHPFHTIVQERARQVPFAGTHIPVLDCTSLAVFKAFFNRTKDWADLEAMAHAEQLNTDAVAYFLMDLLGNDDPRLERLRELAE